MSLITSVWTFVITGHFNFWSTGSSKLIVQRWLALSRLPVFSREISFDLIVWEHFLHCVFNVKWAIFTVETKYKITFKFFNLAIQLGNGWAWRNFMLSTLVRPECSFVFKTSQIKSVAVSSASVVTSSATFKVAGTTAISAWSAASSATVSFSSTSFALASCSVVSYFVQKKSWRKIFIFIL